MNKPVTLEGFRRGLHDKTVAILVWDNPDSHLERVVQDLAQTVVSIRIPYNFSREAVKTLQQALYDTSDAWVLTGSYPSWVVGIVLQVRLSCVTTRIFWSVHTTEDSFRLVEFLP